MLWRDVGKLCTKQVGLDNLRRPIKKLIKKEIYCNKKSIRQSEFYQAMAQGIRPEIMFEIRFADYNNETHFEYENKLYRIIRTYTKNNEILELVCNSVVVDNE